MENSGKTRLNKYLSEVGFCSRREADRLIEEGRITVNGEVPEMGLKVSEQDEIRVNGRLIQNNNETPIYLAFNKPIGIECTTNQKVRGNIVDYINYPKRIFPVGRLDKDSEGLIIMTNDGDIVNKILRQKNNHEKEYLVTVNRPITDRFLQRMGAGVPILDTVTKPCRVEPVSKFVFRIFLTQGLNRQIRRMCEYFDYDVVALKRIRIINISLDVPVGKYREITKSELDELNRLIEPSIKTEEASLVEQQESQQSIRKRMQNTTSRESSQENRPRKNFDREKNNSKNKGIKLKNERLSKRREN
ncbi:MULTISPECIES: 23S rRNA pseudouridine(2604) synthase RluF [Myroides]|uniref:Pseudouridine synthase n=1 Tax=Myroides albus TaxID=2562892 RepID=A0A6I3LMF7_9FLAO|nr:MULTISPECIES: 23S rRNA pseudouridine(2604) synthase RluF [Myroides]MTG98686.1 23S rRNA pseudouridine(2604) synthase RluF [Myroides albus]MVX37283.1 23S rRNA pseudouridine(2604) synthase RluF [Myroides sp. LoEW2-1]UVD78818.1 23S rRNA pseudouridine(2604) synthase RluF [Myroides albus]